MENFTAELTKNFFHSNYECHYTLPIIHSSSMICRNLHITLSILFSYTRSHGSNILKQILIRTVKLASF